MNKTRGMSKPWLLALLTLVVFCVVLWLPFGFNVGGVSEGWGYLNLYNDSGFRSVTPVSPRPLGNLPFMTAAALTPQAFIGMNLAVFWALLLKGALIYSIVVVITRNRPLAFSTMMLFLVFPADTAHLSLRALGSHYAVVMYLLSVWLLLRLHRRFSVFLVVLLWAASIVHMSIYEVGWLLVFCTPALLIWAQRGLSRRLVFLSVLWYVPALFSLVWYIWKHMTIPALQAGYASRVAASSESELETIQQIVVGVRQAYERNLLTGWVEALQQIQPEHGTYLAASLLIALLAGIATWAQGRPAARRSSWLWSVIVPILIALAAIGAGYAAFSITIFYAVTWRVYYYSVLGAGLFWGIVFYFVAFTVIRRRLAFALLTGIGTGLMLLAGLVQHEAWAERAAQQQFLLHGIVDLIPQVGPASEVVLLVVDETGRHEQAFASSGLLSLALQAVYENPQINAIFCAPFSNHRNQVCELNTDTVVVDGLQQSGEFPYNRIVALQYTMNDELILLHDISMYARDGAPNGYDPERLICRDCTPTDSYRTLLDHQWKPGTREQYAAPVEALMPGYGWEPARVIASEQYLVMSGSEANLVSSSVIPYDTLMFRMLTSEGITVHVGSHRIELDVIAGNIYTGPIPAAALGEGDTSIEIRIARGSISNNPEQSANEFDVLLVDWVALVDSGSNLLLEVPDGDATSHVYHTLGSQHIQAGDYEQGVRDLSVALELDPTMYSAYLLRGIAYRELQRYDASIADLTHAIEIDAGYASPFMQRSFAYKALGRLDEYFADLTHVLDMDPDNTTALNLRGTHLVNQQQYLEALGDFNALLALQPEHPTAYGERAIAHYELGNLEQAYEDIGRHLELSELSEQPMRYRRILDALTSQLP